MIRAKLIKRTTEAEQVYLDTLEKANRVHIQALAAAGNAYREATSAALIAYVNAMADRMGWRRGFRGRWHRDSRGERRTV